MILAVGPGTPASLCWDAALQEHQQQQGEVHDEVESDEDDDDAFRLLAASLHATLRGDDTSQGAFGISGPGYRERRREGARLVAQEAVAARRISSSSGARPWQATLRHGGCINTATWLDAPWRLSTVQQESVSSTLHNNSVTTVHSDEYPTQLLTSGDDGLVKFWDVAQALGGASPLAGGWDTQCPYAPGPSAVDIEQYQEHVTARWKSYYSAGAPVPASVHHLASLKAGHEGSVLHVTALHAQPGQVLTSGADGCLRLLHLDAPGSTALIIKPLDGDDEQMAARGIEMAMSKVAYSHCMVNAHVGLIASDRGLHRFDLRLPPREQYTKSLLGPDPGFGAGKCKACAVWTPPWMSMSQLSDGTVDSSYVFAAGASSVVHLYDLRMDGSGAGEQPRTVQKYQPRGFSDRKYLPRGFSSVRDSVLVSGLDVSKNGQELLVSYEKDQIYTFPVYPHTRSLAGPTEDEIQMSPRDLTPPIDNDCLPELASYGGHLNRFTCKRAVYAGPRDEYICTGSDSGHAWILDRATATVTALLAADACSCRGIVPHPVAPVFVSFGSDMTAKLWRATLPVNAAVDDSVRGRAPAAEQAPWETSPATQYWTHIPKKSETLSRRNLDGALVSPDYGNALRTLASAVQWNRYECYLGYKTGAGEPVQLGSMDYVEHRAKIGRLRSQANRLGLVWDPDTPFVFGPAEKAVNVHPADLVPDFPRDWIDLDPRMTPEPTVARYAFNMEQYGPELLAERLRDTSFLAGTDEDRAPVLPWLNPSAWRSGSRELEPVLSSEVPEYEETIAQLLEQTVMLLKDGGNEAVRDGQWPSAVRRYDKAIQYCAVALMESNQGYVWTQGKVQVIQKWSPVTRILVSCRLNLAMLGLKEEVKEVDARMTVTQAELALHIMTPFTFSRGKVAYVDEHNETHILRDELDSVFDEVKALVAKACYRLGVAQLQLSLYESAVTSLGVSAAALTKLAEGGGAGSAEAKSTMNAVTRKLAEANRLHNEQKRRNRQRYQRALATD
jgi:hypothetical protein